MEAGHTGFIDFNTSDRILGRASHLIGKEGALCTTTPGSTMWLSIGKGRSTLTNLLSGNLCLF